MSFSAQYIGPARDVRHVLAQPDNAQFSGSDHLAVLTRQYLAEVAELVDPTMMVVIKTTGHSGNGYASVSLDVGCAQPVPAAPEPVETLPAESSYDNPPQVPNTVPETVSG